MSLSMAFGITEDDISTVLRANWAKVANTDGKDFEEMASDLIVEIDADRVASAALDGGTEVDDQTDAAHEEIRKILIEDGVIKE